VEEHKVTFLPVLSIDIFRRNTRPLDVVADLAHLLQVIDHSPIFQVQLAHGRRMDLDGETTINRILPTHWQDLDLALINLWKICNWNFEVFGEHAQPGGSRLCAAHPDVWVWCILDLSCTHKLLLLLGQDVVHSVAGDERSGAERHIKLIASTIIIAAGLATTSWDLDSKQSRNNRWFLVVQSSIDMPPVETCEVEIILCRNDRLVESLVVWMLELDVLQSFVLWHEAVADDLHLWLVRNGLEIWVQDAPLRIECLAMAVARSFGIEALGEFELSLWRYMSLVLKYHDLVAEERVTDHIEFSIQEGYRLDGYSSFDTIIASQSMHINITYL